MTALDDRPRNGHPIPLPPSNMTFDPPTPVPAAPAEQSEQVRQLRQRLADRTTERDLSQQLLDVDSDTVFDEVRSEHEQGLDRKVAEKIRRRQRRDRLRSGTAAVRRARWSRFHARLDERAERSRQRILDPARTLGTDYRRWMITSGILFSLLAGAAAFMAQTVHHGLVGVDGSWLAYLVEPLASLVLVLSMLAQYTARQRGIAVPRGFIALDALLAGASLLLMTVPWGMRYGWDAGEMTGHMLLPGLVVICITAWHMASSLYSQSIANSKNDPTMQDRLALLRAAVAARELPVDASANQVIKYLRGHLPGGIGHDAARRVARSFLGY